MQMTEDLIRNVIQQVLTQMGGGGPGRQRLGPEALGQGRRLPDRRRRRDGRRGRVQALPEAPATPDRRKAVECVRTICVEQAEELGRMELDETKIGRLDHKVAKLRDAIPQGAPGVEYLRTDNWSGDDGMTLTDYTPVRGHRRDHAGHAQPAHPGRQRYQHAGRGQHRGGQRPPLGGEDRRRRGPTVQQGRSARRSAWMT